MGKVQKLWGSHSLRVTYRRRRVGCLARGDNSGDGNETASTSGMSTVGEALFADMNTWDQKGKRPRHTTCDRSRRPSSAGVPSVVSVIYGHPQAENIKWNIPELNS